MGRYAVAVTTVLMIGTSPLYAQDAMFVVTATVANVHKGPSTGNPVIGKALRGESFEVVRELGSWVSVSWPEAENGVGYLHLTWGTMSRGAGVAGAAPQSDSSPMTPQAAQAPDPTALSRPAFSLPSHVIGLGGRIGTGASGFAGTGRAWIHDALAVQIEAGQATHASTVVVEHVRSVQFAPSLIFSPSNLVTNAIWARPYIGGGVNIYRSTLRSTTGSSVAADNSLGSQIFGGAEFTWSSLPQLVVSADLRRQWTPTVFNGFELGGFGFTMSAHWYVK